MNRIKYPLTLYIVWHPDFKFGITIAEKIYSTFCRDYQNPLSRGLGIPVYFRYVKLENNQPLPIDISDSDKSAIVLLIDNNFFLDDSYRDYIENLNIIVNSNNRIFPVALCKDAHNIGCKLGSLQFINALKFREKPLNLEEPEDLEFSIKKIQTDLLHDCCRLLLSFQPISEDTDEARVGSPIKLFLSHAKIDGEDLTIRFKKFIEDNLKLDVFFDTVDIANGYDFAIQFEQEIKKSALLVFHTDEYSTREWCRREVLIAKKHKSPIVVVHNIKDGEKRAFPYLGNMPTTTINEDEFISFYKIVNLTLYQVLNNLYQINLLESYKIISNNNEFDFIIISTPPELYNFLDINNHKKNTVNKVVVLYPDPPLGIEELNVLYELDSDIQFITPITFENINR
jgi:hypothetical protein